jgi:hypothetical protein
MERTLSSRYERPYLTSESASNANNEKLQLQTAPVLLFFPPNVGANAKVDAQPIRYDFTSG